ncbi:MAG: PIN domain-containing protein [Thermoplasmataceae archaeon]|jgi:predicted nucleic acid-binding protein
MKDESFYDTNILIYAYDLNEPRKRKLCKQIVKDVFSGKEVGAVSGQILVELYNSLTLKLAVPAGSASKIVESFILSNNWLKINYNENTIRAAIRSSLAFKSPFLDTLIAETMKEHALNTIITENEKDFIKIPGMKVVNPIVLKS